ncbi:MAG: ABC transporter ATP-binding protein [Candidatus Rokubacteria bacterium]|nr:ABC transporter ATP-binding protein [Candidatus Rokubacteria bacterium]
MTPLVDARAVAFGYGGAFRLGGVTFELPAGEILGVIGPNASGKTTLIRLLSKVHEPQGGEIRLGGVLLAGIPRRLLARQVAVVPQELSVAFPLTVEELCLMGRYPHADGRFFEGPLDLARAREAMVLAGVLDLRDQPLDALSGGERQRAVLARALAQEPRLLLLDEPTSHLDLRHQREIVGLLRRLNRDRGTTIVLVSHDLNLAGEVADRLMLLSCGRVARLGAPSEVLDEPTLEAAYGCPVRVEKSPVSGRPVVTVRWPDDEGR